MKIETNMKIGTRNNKHLSKIPNIHATVRTPPPKVFQTPLDFITIILSMYQPKPQNDS